jgi:hypothetical protein
MLDIDIMADTELGQRAIDLVASYLKKHPPEQYIREGSGHLLEKNWPVSRAQVNGLRQIAGNEPASITPYANKQAEKHKKALQETEKALKENKEKRDRKPSDEKLIERKEKLELQKKLVQGRIDFWTEVAKAGEGLKKEYLQFSDHSAAYFQRFCIHYLYEMTRRTRGE